MNVYVMVNDYSCNGVCLFIWHMYSSCMYDMQIDPRSWLWGRRTKLVRGRPTGHFWARQLDSPSAYSVCTYSLHIIMFILIYCIIWWDNLIKDFLDLLPVFLVLPGKIVKLCKIYATAQLNDLNVTHELVLMFQIGNYDINPMVKTILLLINWNMEWPPRITVQPRVLSWLWLW